MPRCPFLAAQCSADQPSNSNSFGSAPASSRSLTHSVLPISEAQIKGVSFVVDVACTELLSSEIYVCASQRTLKYTARWRGVWLTGTFQLPCLLIKKVRVMMPSLRVSEDRSVRIMVDIADE